MLSSSVPSIAKKKTGYWPLPNTYIFSYCWTRSSNEIGRRKTVGDALRRLAKLYNNFNECINAIDNHIVCVFIPMQKWLTVNVFIFLPHLPNRSAQSCSQHRFCMLLLSKYLLICARQNSEKSKYVVTSSAVTDWTRSPPVKARTYVRETRARQAGHTAVPISSRTSVCVRR